MRKLMTAAAILVVAGSVGFAQDFKAPTPGVTPEVARGSCLPIKEMNELLDKQGYVLLMRGDSVSHKEFASSILINKDLTSYALVGWSKEEEAKDPATITVCILDIYSHALVSPVTVMTWASVIAHALEQQKKGGESSPAPTPQHQPLPENKLPKRDIRG